MGTFGVVELEIAPDPLPRLARATIVSEIHLLILHPAPEALREDIVVGAPATIPY